MKKMIIVVMMVMAVATGCSSDVKNVDKFDNSVLENLTAIKHEYSTAVQNTDGTVTRYTKVFVHKDGESVLIDETEETYDYLDYEGLFGGTDV